MIFMRRTSFVLLLRPLWVAEEGPFNCDWDTAVSTSDWQSPYWISGLSVYLFISSMVVCISLIEKVNTGMVNKYLAVLILCKDVWKLRPEIVHLWLAPSWISSFHFYLSVLVYWQVCRQKLCCADGMFVSFFRVHRPSFVMDTLV